MIRRRHETVRRALWITAAIGTFAAHAVGQSSTGRFSIDPCTLPDLGLVGDRGWIQSNHDGQYFVVLTDLSANRDLNVADGIDGRKPGETILLGIDIRDRSDSRPDYPVAIRVSLEGGRGGFVRPAGKIYRCRELTFFWNRRNGSRLESAVERIEYSVGSEVKLAGLLPDESAPRRTRPLWAITERLRIEFGETDAARDQQHRDGAADYPVRPEGRPPGDLSGAQIPNPFRNFPADFELFGPNLEVEGVLTVREPFRAYLAFRGPLERSDEVSAVASIKGDNGELVTSGERITLRRLGSSAVFVGSLIILPDGHPDTTTIAGRSLQRPIVVAPGGLWTFEVEREDKKP